MESTSIIKLQSLEPYRSLFPKARTIDSTIKKGADVSHTVEFIPMVVKGTMWQVEKFVDQELRGLSTYKACEKLWYFVKNHIRYKKDERGLEQVRSPRRLIHDGVGDCDCFTTFISTCLSALKIPIINRITKYKKDFFQHIYPIVPLGNGNYIIMDCVVDTFDYEEPYTEKKDFKMDLQYLDGTDENNNINFAGNVDAQELMGWENNRSELGTLFKKPIFNKPILPALKKPILPALQKNITAVKSAMPTTNQPAAKKGVFQNITNVAKKTLNVVNKVNPATVLLRAGILASMKLNVFKVAEQLKWAYLTEAQAKAKGADMSKFGKLKNVLAKMEQIFFSAGGKPENLKEAIITGHGNKNKEVSGLGWTGGEEFSGNEYTPMPELLGAIYYDEFVNGLEGTEGLGEPVTATTIAAASTVMGSIAVLLKSIGNLFPNRKGEAEAKNEGGGDAGSESASESAEPSVQINPDATNNNGGNGSEEYTTDTQKQQSTTQSAETITTSASNDSGGSAADSTQTPQSATGAKKDAPTGLKLFWENNKKWIKPVGIGVVVTSVLVAGYKMIKGKDKAKKPATGGQATMNGFSTHKHKKRKKGKAKGSNGKKNSLPLM